MRILRTLSGSRALSTTVTLELSRQPRVTLYTQQSPVSILSPPVETFACGGWFTGKQHSTSFNVAAHGRDLKISPLLPHTYPPRAGFPPKGTVAFAGSVVFDFYALYVPVNLLVPGRFGVRLHSRVVRVLSEKPQLNASPTTAAACGFLFIRYEPQIRSPGLSQTGIPADSRSSSDIPAGGDPNRGILPMKSARFP